MFNLNKFKNLDLFIIIPTIILALFGAVNVFATTYFPNKTASSLFTNQILFYVVGFAIMLLLTCFDYKVLKKSKLQLLIFVLNICLLIFVLFAGSTVYGATRWIDLGFFSLQPSELAKIAIILNTAFLMTLKNDEIAIKKNKTKIKLFLQLQKILKKYYPIFINSLAIINVGIVGLLISMQNSLGNTILIVGIFSLTFFVGNLNSRIFLGSILIILIIANLSFGFIGFSSPQELVIINTRWFQLDLINVVIALGLIVLVYRIFKTPLVVMAVITVLVIPLSFFTTYAYNNILQPYQRERIETFINPSSDLEASWNRDQSLIACGSGRLLGKGFLQGSQSNYKYLPFSYNDFAFCSFAEQFGLIGSTIVLLLFFTLIVRGIFIAERVSDTFGKLVVYGAIGLITFNAIQHIGMNTGLLPITGVPLPLMSYGGTSVLVVLIAIGLILSIGTDPDNRKLEVTYK